MSVDISGWQAKRAMVEKQARFATAVALTQTAKDAQAAVSGALAQIFDAPTPFTQKAIAITPARKESLVAWVFAKDIQAKYLAVQEVGGAQQPRPGAPLVVPVNIRRTVYGGIGRGGIKRELGKRGTFTVGPNDHSKLPPGIYRRAQGKRRLAKPVLLVALEQSTQYKPRFGFKDRVLRVARDRFAPNFRTAFERALANAR